MKVYELIKRLLDAHLEHDQILDYDIIMENQHGEMDNEFKVDILKGIRIVSFEMSE